MHQDIDNHISQHFTTVRLFTLTVISCLHCELPDQMSEDSEGLV